jgi:hypothetical protein
MTVAEAVRVSWRVTDEGMQLVCTRFPALTSLTLDIFSCVTDTAMRAVAGLTSLTSLNIGGCRVTDEGMRLIIGLTSLNIRGCRSASREGVQALLRSLRALRELTAPDGQRMVRR